MAQATLLTYAKPDVLKQFSQQDKDFIAQKLGDSVRRGANEKNAEVRYKLLGALTILNGSKKRSEHRGF